VEYINPPTELPRNVTHGIFFSEIYGHEIGYNIYLPHGYEAGDRKYPVLYHLHGWTGNESSEIHTCEKVYSGEQTIVVFPNSSPVIEDRENLPVESMLMDEFIPSIEDTYRVMADREHRRISGFSMGGGMAFYLAANYPDTFSSVTAYAGTYHHSLHRGYKGVGEKPERASELYRDIMSEERYLEEGNALCMARNILYVVRENRDRLQGRVNIKIHVGTRDPLFCENEIMHLYLDSLGIPHEYNVFDGSDHELSRIL
jgi:enterochelin esterase-like enzyme